jgi:methyl halide transferase
MSNKKNFDRGNTLKVSIMDKKKAEERAEAKALEVELAHPRWTDIWATEFPPRFDKQTVCPALQYLIDKGHILKGRALVPGCGRGYDVTALANDDRYVVGVDISEDAIFSANERLHQILTLCEKCVIPHDPPISSLEFKCMSFFDLETDVPEKLFDFVYDYTFLCALDPRIHKKWKEKMTQLVKEGGELLCIVYPIMEKTGGPPFQMSLEYVENLCAPEFRPFNGFAYEGPFHSLPWSNAPNAIEMLPPELCHPGRDGQGGNSNSAASGIIRFKRINLSESDDDLSDYED